MAYITGLISKARAYLLERDAEREQVGGESSVETDASALDLFSAASQAVKQGCTSMLRRLLGRRPSTAATLSVRGLLSEQLAENRSLSEVIDLVTPEANGRSFYAPFNSRNGVLDNDAGAKKSPIELALRTL